MKEKFMREAIRLSLSKMRGNHGGPFGARFWALKLWLSPDGRYAITERPVFPIPQSWEGYEGWVGAEAHNLRVSAHSKFQFGAISGHRIATLESARADAYEAWGVAHADLLKATAQEEP